MFFFQNIPIVHSTKKNKNHQQFNQSVPPKRPKVQDLEELGRQFRQVGLDAGTHRAGLQAGDTMANLSTEVGWLARLVVSQQKHTKKKKNGPKSPSFGRNC